MRLNAVKIIKKVEERKMDFLLTVKACGVGDDGSALEKCSSALVAMLKQPGHPM